MLGYFMSCDASEPEPEPAKELTELKAARIHAVKLFLEQDGNTSAADPGVELQRILKAVELDRQAKAGSWLSSVSTAWSRALQAVGLSEAPEPPKPKTATMQFIEKELYMEQSPMQELLHPQSPEPPTLLEALDVAQTLIGEDGLNKAASQSLSSAGIKAFSFMGGVPDMTDEAATIADFGVPSVAVVKPGAAVCKDNCHYKGLCDKGTCFCQPGRFGTTCESIRESTVGTFNLVQAAIVAGGFVLVSMMLTLACLFSHHRKKRLTELETGYSA